VKKLMPMDFWQQKRGQHMSATVSRKSCEPPPKRGGSRAKGVTHRRTMGVDLLMPVEVDRSWTRVKVG